MPMSFAVLTFAAVFATVCAALISPALVGRWTVGAGILTATWMDVRPAPGVTVSDLLLAASLPLLLVAHSGPISLRSYRSGPQSWMLSVGLLVVIGGALGAIANQDQPGTEVAGRLILSLVIATAVIWLAVQDRKDWMAAAVLFVVGAAVSGFFALTEPQGEFLGRTVGLTNHPNHLGLSMLLAISLALPLLRSEFRHQVVGAAIALPILTLALLASGSRAALVGLAVWLFVLVVVSRRPHVPLIAVGILALTTAAIVLPGSVGPGSSALNRSLAPNTADAESSAYRQGLYQEARELILSSPVVGRGFSNALVYHSVPLQIMVIAGVPGLLALLVAVRAAFRSIAAALQPNASLVTRSSSAGVVATMAVLVVSNMLFDRYLLLALSLMSAGLALQARTDRQFGRYQQSISPSV